MVGTKYNEPCESCGSQIFVPLNSFVLQDGEDSWEDGNAHMDRVGYKCIECEHTVLTREIPERHASDDSLDLPESADRDMVREDDTE